MKCCVVGTGPSVTRPHLLMDMPVRISMLIPTIFVEKSF